MDKLSALSMFVATAEHGSFSRAAEQLGKTPSALTKAVSHLEAELGAQLFERSTRRTALTEAGRLYLETARQVLQRLHDAGEEIGQLKQGLHGNLRLTAPLALTVATSPALRCASKSKSEASSTSALALTPRVLRLSVACDEMNT